MTSINKRDLGLWGETAAAQFLQAKGYVILARNYFTAHGELDIIACKDDALIFIEVKTRSSNRVAYPEQAVTPRKQQSMLSAAEHYLSQHPESPDTWQFDILAVTRRSSLPPLVEHFENVIA